MKKREEKKEKTIKRLLQWTINERATLIKNIIVSK